MKGKVEVALMGVEMEAIKKAVTEVIGMKVTQIVMDLVSWTLRQKSMVKVKPTE